MQVSITKKFDYLGVTNEERDYIWMCLNRELYRGPSTLPDGDNTLLDTDTVLRKRLLLHFGKD